MLKIIFKTILFKGFYYFNWPKIKPINLVISLTGRCNSRCQTCHVWEKDSPAELALAELDKIFISIGKGPYEIILTGGEPFLRADIVEICQQIAKRIKPGIIIIPTNGLLTEIIEPKIKAILETCQSTKLVINVSLDEIGEKDDQIRGVAGAFAKATETFRRLREIENNNFSLNIHTVISRFNIDRLADIQQYIQDNLKPDAYITEIAESRVELGTVNDSLDPSAEKYGQAIDSLIAEIRKQKFSGLAKITQIFRQQYYQLVKKILKSKKPAIPCYAGLASAQISASGEVWACCIKAQSLGNLKSHDYNFMEIWQSQQARKVRQEIKNSKCFCPLANASYTNMLMHYPTLTKTLPALILK